MKKNTVAIASIISVVLSPIIGGMGGKLIAVCDLFQFHHVYFDDGLVYLGSIAWIAASILFYVHFTNNADSDKNG